jgi:hypothetical protein
MAGASISHVLIVAGPSGAGKSAFLRELAAGRLQPDILAHLPASSETWREVWCNRRHEWGPLLTPEENAPTLPGIAVHFDITFKWMMLRAALELDPFWQVLGKCQAVTVVNIRPPHERLVDQWTQAHLGVRDVWSVRRKTLLAAWSPRLLAALRKLRKRAPKRKRWQYPRPVRFLKHLDRGLQNCAIPTIDSFNFYRSPGNIETMLRSWDAVLAAKTATLPIKRIELTPDSAAEIARTFRWRVVAVQQQAI